MNNFDPRLEVVFNAACEISDASARIAYLDEACAPGSLLRQEVEAMLLADQAAGDFMKAPGIEIPSEGAGDRIGRYTLVEVIGEGGFGVVWMAKQYEPMRRRVALKIIKVGMDTRQFLARFENERQALAMMEHPSIAKVFDGGATHAGRPYFVMELVTGVPITDYADARRLSTPERLTLFIQVCHAVQHAHQKGIIHRDLKPANILVTEQEGKPVPKVIDFGVAKATEQSPNSPGCFTGVHQRIGTPAYMSPEQAGLGGLDLDTRSDLYSLGVVLYELLIGATPFTKGEIEKAGFDETFRLIRDKNPPKPSTRLNALLSQELTIVAALRRTEPARLLRIVHGELDWIVMKALEKNRARRYESATALALDVERYLRNEPVTAVSPSPLYIGLKFARRHRLVVSLTAAALLLLVLFVGVMLRAGYLAHDRALRAEQHRQQMEMLLARASRAEQEATDKLWNSYLAQARASRWSGRAGRRFSSLAVLAKAAAIRPSIELRNEAIACLALVDLRPAGNFGIPGSVFCAMDANFKRQACSDSKGNIYISSLPEKTELMKLPGFGQPVVWAMQFSPDGRFLAAKYGHGATSAQAWDLAQKQVVCKTSPFEDGPMAFSSDSSSLAVGYGKGSIAIFSLTTGQETRRLTSSVAPYSLRFDHSGRKLAVANHTRSIAQVIDLAADRVLLNLSHPQEVYGLAWRPDDSQLATTCADGNVYVWDLPAGRRRFTLKSHTAPVVHASFNPSGTLLATYGWDGEVHIWDAINGAHLLQQPCWSIDTRFSRDGSRLGFERGYLDLAPAHERRALPGHPGRVDIEGQVSTDGRWLVTAAGDGVRIWDLETFQQASWVPAKDSGRHRAVFDQNLSHFFIASQSDIYKYELSFADSNSVTLPRLGPPLAFPLPSVSSLAFLRTNGQLGVVEVGSAQLPEHLKLLEPRHSGLAAVSPDGKWLAAGNWKGGDVTAWNIASGQSTLVLRDRANVSVVFSPDSRWLVTGSGKEYRFWRVGSWRPSHIVDRTQDAGDTLGVMTFTHDGSILAIALSRSQIRLLEPATGQELATLDASAEQPVCFSPDGSRLVTRGQEGQLYVWDLGSIRQSLSAMHLDWQTP